jgi:hypothetical protein
MNDKRYKIPSAIIFWLQIVLLSATLISTLIIAVAAKNVGLQLDGLGLRNFFLLYEIPLKLATATFAVFAIWLTLERISQTERQLDIMSDHNKFNNYYKHIDEFVKFVSEDPLVILWATVIDYDKRALLTLLYKDYYYENYRKFVPHLNPNRVTLIETFYARLLSTRLVTPNINIETLPIQELQTLATLIDGYCQMLIDPVTDSMSNEVQAYLGTLSLTPVQIQTEWERYKLINRIYWGSSFYMNVMAFDGKPSDRSPEFVNNYENYLSYLGRK